MSRPTLPTGETFHHEMFQHALLNTGFKQTRQGWFDNENRNIRVVRNDTEYQVFWFNGAIAHGDLKFKMTLTADLNEDQLLKIILTSASIVAE